MRARAWSTAAAVIAASLALTGCASGEQERSSAPEGPNGYTLSASFDDGSMLWWDGGAESGLTDLILEDEDGRMFASCLGRGPLLCLGGPDDARGALVIGPAGAERAVMHWYGQDVELARGENTPDDAPPVFAGVMPPVAAEGEYSLEVFDAAGAVVMAQ